MWRVFKKTLLVLILFLTQFIYADARDRYVYFIEDTSYKELLNCPDLKALSDISIKGLSIQRKNSEDFSFFKGIAEGRPSSIDNEDVPVYDPSEKNRIHGNVLKDGTLYVPSKILLYGQSNEDKDISFFHISGIEELNEKIKEVSLEDKEIIICGWTSGKKIPYESYLQPLIYYDGRSTGVFYSNSTRSIGILDYRNLNSLILKGNMENMLIKRGDIETIYFKRIESLKSKRVFLTLYGYLLGITALINTIAGGGSLKKYLPYLGGLSAVSPFVVLLEPLLGVHGIYSRMVLILFFSIILSMYFKRKGGLWILAAAFLTTIYIDSMLGSFLLKNSLLSYEPALGARFYGIGNEYLGIILGYTFIILREKSIKREWIIWALNSSLILLSISGNNFGGFLTCLSMVFITSPVWMTLTLFITGITSVYFSNNHIGVFFREIISGNMEYLKSAIVSKLSTLKRLFSISIWMRLSIIITAIYIVEFFRGRFKFYGKAYQIVVCCIVVAFTNDSGIVSMALLLGVYINYLFFKNSLEEQQWNI